ncbi:hypothetical protein J2Z22_004631 [Paenibacillus forsythiae]|uniref:Uncharacterized protein n=1 Tax=Paenibacillus forsythiae TaxID=365616 RepID=A0ABU3HE90_9BACL|nr:hypothetical protein [Paenibacillus forsythiae]MDT3429035.1 hypothetical protein [Paenibacillus forsythiae]
MKIDNQNEEWDKKSKDSPESNAYSFLFNAANNEYDEIYQDYIEESHSDPTENQLGELWEQLIGEEELEQQRLKLEERKPGFKEDALNILECPMCGCDDVPNVELDIPLETSNKRLLSIRLLGGQCTNPSCSETFFHADDLKRIEEIKCLLNTAGEKSE